ncbi:hypothetical protein CSQ96_12950 [Janthinobacterium sp. BJB412]|nr:hypothetical protein CSQ96_12950 [Janthinobacterium sp. BJB412]
MLPAMSVNPPRRRAPAARGAGRHLTLLAAIGLLAGVAGAAGAVGAAGASVPADAAGTSASAARTATAAAARTAGLAGAPPASRAPSAAEADSFAAFHHALYPDAAPPSPRWRISRAKGQRRWQVLAELDSTPEPARAGLCRLQRSSFHYDERARKDQRWSAGDGGAASASASASASSLNSGSNSAANSTSALASASNSNSNSTYVWLARGAVCTTPQPGQPGQPALLQPALSDAAAVALLRGQAELLTRARLLFAGNTSCARLRALDFTLQALGPAPAGAAGAGAMYELRYRSDRDNEARVAVRQHRAELTAWNVNCPAP